MAAIARGRVYEEQSLARADLELDGSGVAKEIVPYEGRKLLVATRLNQPRRAVDSGSCSGHDAGCGFVVAARSFRQARM